MGGAKACVVVVVDSNTSNTEAAPNIAIMIAAILCDCLPTGGGDFGWRWWRHRDDDDDDDDDDLTIVFVVVAVVEILGVVWQIEMWWWCRRNTFCLVEILATMGGYLFVMQVDLSIIYLPLY